LQEKTLKITKSTEKLVSSGHISSEEAIADAYRVLSRCAEYLEAIDRRKELLEKSIEFFLEVEEVGNIYTFKRMRQGGIGSRVGMSLKK